MFASATRTLPAGKHPSWHKQDGRVGRGKSNRRRGPEAPEHPQQGSGAPVSSAAWGAMHCDVSESRGLGLGVPPWSCPLLSAPPPGVSPEAAPPCPALAGASATPTPCLPQALDGGSQRAGFQGWRAVTSEPPEMSSGWPQPPSVPSWFPTSDTWGLRPPCPASATRRDSDPMQRMCLKLSRELRAGARSSPGGRLVLVSMHTRTRLPGCVAAEQGPPSPPQGPAS